MPFMKATDPRGLKTPPNIREIFGKIRTVLDEELTPRTPGRSGWSFGGGTMLAMRWGHRTSTDIDVFISGRTDHQDIAPPGNDAIQSRLGDIGAVHEDWSRGIQSRFNDTTLQIARRTPAPRHGATTEMVDGRPTRTLSSAQILSMKLLYRENPMPVRDLYDLGVAREAEPDALEVAVNNVDEAKLEERMTGWVNGREAYKREAQAELAGIPEKHRAQADDPAHAAIEAVNAARYRTLAVEVTQDSIHVKTRSGLQTRTRTYTSAKDWKRHAVRDGIDLAVRNHGGSWNRTNSTVLNALASGRAVEIAIKPGPVRPGIHR